MSNGELPIAMTWRQLTHHADQCGHCVNHVQRLGRISDDPRRADAEIHPHLCSEGQELHAQWVAAKGEWLEGTRGNRQRLGLVGLPEDQVAVRIAMLVSLTPEQFKAILAIEPAAARESEIRALEAAWRRRHVLAEVRVVALSELDDWPLYRWTCACGHVAGRDYFSVAAAQAGWQRHLEGRALAAGEAAAEEVISAAEPVPEERQCPGCGVMFIPRFPRQTYHDSACRQRAWRNR